MARRRPPALDRFPIEVIFMILRYLGSTAAKRYHGEAPDAYIRGSWQESQQPSWYSLELQPLFPLCLVSRSLCNVIQPILYADFLLGHVKRIHIHPYLVQGLGGGMKINRSHHFWTGKAMKHLAEQRYIGDEEAQDAFRELARALTRKVMPWLSAADLVTVIQVDSPHGEEIVRAAGLRGISRLPLRILDISHRAAGALLNVCPGLETLSLHMCGRVSQIPRLPNLKTLNLTFRDRRVPVWGGARDHGTRNFQPADAVKSLGTHRATLETLHIDPGTEIRTLLLVQFLPPSIISLHLAGRIDDDLSRLESAMLGLAEAVLAGQFQNLKQIKWDREEELDGEHAAMAKLAAASVRFEYDSWRMTRSTFGFGEYSPPPAQYACGAYPGGIHQPLPDVDDPDL
ncbi:hypothetical protein BDV10DRAFT_197311 [Aspergillus recurvatus]